MQPLAATMVERDIWKGSGGMEIEVLDVWC